MPKKQYTPTLEDFNTFQWIEINYDCEESYNIACTKSWLFDNITYSSPRSSWFDSPADKTLDIPDRETMTTMFKIFWIGK